MGAVLAVCEPVVWFSWELLSRSGDVMSEVVVWSSPSPLQLTLQFCVMLVAQNGPVKPGGQVQVSL